MNNHEDFILSPITGILKEVVAANAAIGSGIETYPLSEYILQSIFLKMTGFQEQKMKCIVWELATNDYEYRYKRYSLSPFGECSTYREKKEIYKDLLDLIKKFKPDFDVTSGINKSTITADTILEVKMLFSGSNVSTWVESSFFEFTKDRTLITATQFGTDKDLFENVLQEKYDLLYKHRNRCAHNTLSYQENLPTLKTLLKSNPKDDNYFVRFTLLVLIDKIFILLYKEYTTLLKEN